MENQDNLNLQEQLLFKFKIQRLMITGVLVIMAIIGFLFKDHLFYVLLVTILTIVCIVSGYRKDLNRSALESKLLEIKHRDLPRLFKKLSSEITLSESTWRSNELIIKSLTNRIYDKNKDIESLEVIIRHITMCEIHTFGQYIFGVKFVYCWYEFWDSITRETKTKN
jgi:hypothetical protein